MAGGRLPPLRQRTTFTTFFEALTDDRYVKNAVIRNKYNCTGRYKRGNVGRPNNCQLSTKEELSILLSLPRPCFDFPVGSQHLVGTLQRVQGAGVVVDAGGGVVVGFRDAVALYSRVGAGDGGHEAAGVGVDGVGENLFRGAGFQQVAQVEDANAVRDVFDHGKVMGDKKVGRAGFLLDVFHQVDHLGLDGHVQRGNALIGNDQLGVHN